MDYTLMLLIVMGAAVIATLQGLSRRLAAMHARQELLLRHLGLTDGEPSAEVRALALDPKRRIDAIRLYREQTGKELKQAVEAIDRLSAPLA